MSELALWVWLMVILEIEVLWVWCLIKAVRYMLALVVA